jgi:hypothetical protein
MLLGAITAAVALREGAPWSVAALGAKGHRPRRLRDLGVALIQRVRGLVLAIR